MLFFSVCTIVTIRGIPSIQFCSKQSIQTRLFCCVCESHAMMQLNAVEWLFFFGGGEAYKETERRNEKGDN